MGRGENSGTGKMGNLKGFSVCFWSLFYFLLVFVTELSLKGALTTPDGKASCDTITTSSSKTLTII